MIPSGRSGRAVLPEETEWPPADTLGHDVAHSLREAMVWLLRPNLGACQKDLFPTVDRGASVLSLFELWAGSLAGRFGLGLGPHPAECFGAAGA